MTITIIQLLGIIVTSLIAGCILWHSISAKATRFTEGEETAILTRINAMKETDTQTYTKLVLEWDAFIHNKKAQINSVSTSLQNIICKVRSL